MFTTPINTAEDSLERVGGKGRSLAKMARAGFAVPGGFLVTADAYRDFVSTHGLQAEILKLAEPRLKDGYPAFDECATAISELILATELSDALKQEILAAYAAVDNGLTPVAVRSSANAEDLPGFSFAGQQETYLNVKGGAEVIEAVHKCWASLWTAQAISYRHQ
ncbi:MAG TPA: pyruvate, phosphate dikinase, partial [Gammaproteobacteria bacterium]|nr:pyruvate, phosphate dikinase [Gammaproteobacteria bacterium]